MSKNQLKNLGYWAARELLGRYRNMMTICEYYGWLDIIWELPKE